MKKFLLLLAAFLMISLSSISQSGFMENRYYQERYNISVRQIDYNSYWEYDRFGNVCYYEWWQKAQWYSYSGTQTYYAWNGRSWVSYYKYGTYWYYTWQNYKRYYYVNGYGYKQYTN